MRSAAGCESPEAGSVPAFPVPMSARPSTAAVIATPVLALQNTRHSAAYLRPLQIAANFVLRIEVELAGHAGDLTGPARGTGSQAGYQAVGVEPKGVQARPVPAPPPRRPRP